MGFRNSGEERRNEARRLIATAEIILRDSIITIPIISSVSDFAKLHNTEGGLKPRFGFVAINRNLHTTVDTMEQA